MTTNATAIEPISIPVLDKILSAQIAVAWAGESGEECRLGWWKTDLKSEFGGEDLFRRLLPNSWEWAVLQALREAARRKDAQLRSEDHDADLFVTLFSFGFVIDERLDERFLELKRSGESPLSVLPRLREVISDEWNPDAFMEWLDGHGSVDFTKVPAGRRLKGKQPESLELATDHLLAGLKPLGDVYPMPHYRRSS